MLQVKGLCKSYKNFSLKDISFNLPMGYIMGFIGLNGSGKTTTLKSILNIVKADSGEIKIFDKDLYKNELDIKKDIGFMLGGFDFYRHSKLSAIVDVYKRFYTNWNDNLFQKYLKEFNLDLNKKPLELSAGMKVKFSLSLALSHDAKLIILDEPTSGLDPLARDEILEIFQSIIENGDKSILFSTHITSDLDKCADYIIFIKDGKLVANDTKDNLINLHKLVKGDINLLTEELTSKLISYKKNKFSFTGLIKTIDLKNQKDLVTEDVNLENIIVYYNRGVKNEEFDI